MRKILTIAIGALALAGCYNDSYEELYPMGTAVCDTMTVTYAKDIKPILDSKCATSGCHDAASAPASGGYDLSAYAGAQPIALNGKMVGSINWKAGFSAMPKNLPKLSQCEIDKISRWVNQGALNN